MALPEAAALSEKHAAATAWAGEAQAVLDHGRQFADEDAPMLEVCILSAAPPTLHVQEFCSSPQSPSMRGMITTPKTMLEVCILSAAPPRAWCQAKRSHHAQFCWLRACSFNP